MEAAADTRHLVDMLDQPQRVGAGVGTVRPSVVDCRPEVEAEARLHRPVVGRVGRRSLGLVESVVERGRRLWPC